MNGSQYVALPGLEAAPLENGAVLYHPHTKKFIMLNRSAALIWSELTAGVLPQEIATRSRHPSGTVIVTGDVPPRTTSPTRRKYGQWAPR